MRLILLALIAATIVACSPSASAIESARVALPEVAIHIPISWRRLDNRFNKGETLASFGDTLGSKNKQSIIAFRLSGVIGSDEQFDQQYCEEYARLSVVSDIYDQESSEIKVESSNFEGENNRCIVYYQWSPPNTNIVRGMDLVFNKGSDLIVIEGTSIDGSDFELVKQLVLKTEKLS